MFHHHSRPLEYCFTFVIFLELGNTNFDMGNFRGASHAFETALKLNPRDPKICFELGNAYAALGMSAKAIQSYEQVRYYVECSCPCKRWLLTKLTQSMLVTYP